MTKRNTFNVFIIVLVICLGYLYYMLRPDKIRDYNYAHESVNVENNKGKISSLSSEKSDITISSKDIIIGSTFLAILCYYLFYYGTIIYCKSK